MLHLLLLFSMLFQKNYALICLYGSYCQTDSDCVPGTFCNIQSKYYSQCVFNTTNQLKTHCIGVNNPCGGSSKCCTGECSSYNQCVPTKPPQCTLPTGPSIPSTAPTKPTPSPINSFSKAPSRLPSSSPTKSPTRLPSLVPKTLPSKTPSILPSTSIPTTTRLPTVSTLRPSKRPSRSPTGPTLTPSYRPKLYITIGQSSGDTLNIAEVWFYSRGRRLPSSLFKASATSYYGTFLGPVVDPLGDTFGRPELVNDDDLTTSLRTHNSAYNPYYPPGHGEILPRIILTTDESTHFDQIVIYNRRLPKAQHRDAGANIQVLLYYPLINTTLWQSYLKGTHYIYNFTNVNSGNTAPADLPSTTLDNGGDSGGGTVRSSPKPSPSPTFDPTIYYYYSPPVPGKAPTKLVITIDQTNGNSVLVTEVQFKRNGNVVPRVSSLLQATSTTKRVPGVLNGLYPYGLESNVLDGNLNTFFWSLNATVDDDADPTLIIYQQDISRSFVFDEMIVYNVPYQPLQYSLVGATISIFYFSSIDNRRIPVWNSTFVSEQSVYDFTGIPLHVPTALPTTSRPSRAPVTAKPTKSPIASSL